VIPLLDEDMLDLLLACAVRELTPGRVALRADAAVGVVAAAQGYPGEVRKGDAIEGLDELEEGVLCFHAGTARDAAGTLRTSGGRVLTVVGTGSTLVSARRRAYANVERVRFEGAWHRSDIALTAAMEVAR
jgi:phosphoribosylamine---glycine ligase